MLEDQKLKELVMTPTAEEQRLIKIRPAIEQEYVQEWEAAKLHAKIHRKTWEDPNGHHTEWPGWMTFPVFLDKRMQTLFGHHKTWDHKLKKQLWNLFPQFRMTEKEWRPQQITNR